MTLTVSLLGILLKLVLGTTEKKEIVLLEPLTVQLVQSSITGSGLTSPLPLSKMAAKTSSRKNDIITTFHHLILRGQSGYVGWVVTAGPGVLDQTLASEAQGGVMVGWPDVIVGVF